MDIKRTTGSAFFLIVTLMLYPRIGWWLAHRSDQLCHTKKISADHVHLAARPEVPIRRTHHIIVGFAAYFPGCWTLRTHHLLHLECTALANADAHVNEMAMVSCSSAEE
ncbi:hypothetical protein TSMEX_003578 [Taenia solium]|eukprot:TsM_000879500 transcript=TsM_000879500 gene=TsM_000879500